MYEIRELTGAALEASFPLMKELRPHLDLDRYLRIYKEARLRDDYKIVGLYRGEDLAASMGYRILYDYVHGKHLYVDDLVVTKDLRNMGLGARLLKFAVQEAEKENCDGLRLCTGIDNQDGRRFYEREGWQGRAIAFKFRLNNQ